MMHEDVLTPVLPPQPTGMAPEPWWERFKVHGLERLSATAQAAVEVDARFIVDRCICPPSDEEAWSGGRVRTGIVVGAVQSGKTASMLAVGSMLLDRGTDVLVVLAGTRVALWRQTLSRLVRQLDGSAISPRGLRKRRKARTLVPDPLAVLGQQRPSPTEYMRAAEGRVARSLKGRRPVIVVIPKQDDHMLAIARMLQRQVGIIASSSPGRRLHMVILDDEADDGSVLDAEANKIIPHRIEMLWRGQGQVSSETCSPILHATYVAYTATPQANFLQSDTNPLSPRSFCAALRTPYKAGGPPDGKRSPSFTEPMGLHRHYCGGEGWYVEPHHLTVAEPFPKLEAYDSAAEHRTAVESACEGMLQSGVRAFLVAAALRDLQATACGRLSYADIAPGQALEVSTLKKLPSPTGMLIHPSASLDAHWSEAERVRSWANGPDSTPQDLGPERDLELDGSGWLEELNQSPELWQCWLEAYKGAQHAIGDYPGGAELGPLSAVNWFEVEKRVRRLIPHVTLRVVNSDPAADDRPRYEVERPATVEPEAPHDLLTIFVSGNVMSRGITLEGLTTSVFYRPASVPVADTQMQMQRWFGYRGPHYPLCRLFAFDDQIRLFRSYHEYDIAMRREICASMDDGSFASPTNILQGSYALATAKVRTQRLPLHPGATPSIRLLEVDEPELTRSNEELVRSALGSGPWSRVRVREKMFGLLRDEPWGLQQAATFLDGLRYASHDPLVEGDPRYERWKALERHLDISPEEGPLLRTPGIHPKASVVGVRGCPYSIAAYLRLWSAALKRDRIDGLTTSDRLESSWSLEHSRLPTRIPIQVGIRFGPLAPIDRGPLEGQGIRPMIRGAASRSPCMLSTLWGSRGTSGDYLGDQRFDYHDEGNLSPPALHGSGPFWRPADHPALLLIHIVQPRVEGQSAGRFGVTVGLSLPHGGPEQFAAIGEGRSPWDA